ncbi:MAG: DUF3298 domain-containing protein [Oscillospiraceae bacterium]|nr:DUF3298 domain-containing protein [Oscillospiraceae bacterium]
MTTLIALFMSLLLTACSAATMADVKSAPPPDVLLTEEPAQETIRYTVELRVCEDAVQAEDGTPLASYRFRLPVLTACREDGTAITEPETELETQAVTAAAAFNERFDGWAEAEEFQTVAAGAAEDYAWRRTAGYEWSGGYTMELDCTVYQTERMVSVSGLYYSYTGGAHPNTYLMGWNFDLDAGTFFEPELLAEDSAMQEAVAAELVRQARARAAENSLAPEEFFWSDYETIIADWGSYAVSFDETGMRVAFSPYELAAYAAGAQEFQLSYEWLEPWLSAHGRELLGLEAEE